MTDLGARGTSEADGFSAIHDPTAGVGFGAGLRITGDRASAAEECEAAYVQLAGSGEGYPPRTP